MARDRTERRFRTVRTVFPAGPVAVDEQLIPLNVSLTYLENGWKSGWVSDEADKTVFSLTSLETGDEGVLAEGSFAAAAGYKEPLSSGEADTSRTMQITGSFSATLPRFPIKEN